MSRQKKHTLNKQQQRIVDRIRRLNEAREPLNIAAIRRRRPHLIRAAHKMKPFWSWKEAISAAGLRYSQIKKELEDVCECLYCGAEKANLGSHLYIVHDIYPEDYLAEYPGQDMISDRLRADKSYMLSRVLRHWEPLWTPEYVLERAHEFRKRGLPLHSAWVAANDKPFYSAAIRYFGRWNAVLETIGVDAEEATRKGRLNTRRYPNKGAVRDEIRRRHRKGLPINSSGVRPTSVPRAQAHRGRGRPTAAQRVKKRSRTVDLALWTCAKEYFGSWGAALKSAGFNPGQVHRAARPKQKYATPASVKKELRRRHRNKLPLKVAALLKPPAEDSALVTAARQHCGGWVEALRAARVPRPPRDNTNPTGPKRRYPDKRTVLTGIRRRKRSKLPLNATALVKGKQADSALMRSACEYFGSWGKALKAAGLNPARIRLHPGPKPR